MRVLYLTDRLSIRGGADLHLLQVIRWAVRSGCQVTLAVGRIVDSDAVPEGVDVVRIRGLSAAVDSTARLGGLDGLIQNASVIHIQNVMNPAVLRRAVATGKALVTVQDHRVFCPGMGKVMPDGSRCGSSMNRGLCASCLPDSDYCNRLVDLTTARRDAIRESRLVVLSEWMAGQLAEVGLQGADVIPPWVGVDHSRRGRRRGFLMGGRLVAHKGVLDGLEAWRESKIREPLTIAGDGPLIDRFDGAETLGWVTRSELKLKLARSIALLFPSSWQEPFGMLGIEALAQGTPVVAAESGGMGEWTDIGCVRVAPGDVKGMATAIKELAGNPSAARSLGQEGRENVGQRFAQGLVEDRLAAVYSSIEASETHSPT